MNSEQSFPGVEYDAGSGGDIYLGRPEALIAAGLVRADQIPGRPGMPIASVTFIDGVQQDKYARNDHDEHWMQVTMQGRNIRLTKGITIEEKRKRKAAQKAEIEAMERDRPKKDIGADGALKAIAEAGAQFKPNDRVWIGRAPAVVTGEYKLHSVRWPNGEFIDAQGHRISYQYGYTCQYRNGEEYFFAAHELSNEQGEPTYLRLVSGARKQEERPMLAFRGH